MLCLVAAALYAMILVSEESLSFVREVHPKSMFRAHLIVFNKSSPPRIMLLKCRSPGIQYGNDCTLLFLPFLLLATFRVADSNLVGSNNSTAERAIWGKISNHEKSSGTILCSV